MAVLVLVVLALTGFSTGSHHGISKSRGGKSRSGSHDSDSSGGGGGGCSSSSQDHDDTDDDSYSGSSGNTSATAQVAQDAQVELVSCVTKTEPYATVQVTNPNSTGDYFTVTVTFLDADSGQVDLRTVDEFVAANDTTRVQVDLSDPGLAAKVDHCVPEPHAPAG